MPQPTAVILIVGLTRRAIGDHTPHLRAFARDGQVRTVVPVLPAVTCSVQASMLTGRPVGGESGHGVVGNGWYHRELSEVHFWKQSNRLVQAPKVWDTLRARDPSVTTANLFWWFNMYSDATYALTPRPIYKADGRKMPDCWSRPSDLRDTVQSELGPFPLFKFWGPGASVESSRWIAEAARLTVERHDPTLTLVYLPHLDYAHQKSGPDGPEARDAEREVDGVFGALAESLRARGRRLIVVSEYGIEPVSGPVALNRTLREAGFLAIRTEDGRELLDPGASAAFAVADHQVAHVYVHDPAQVSAVGAVVAQTPGVEQVLDRDAQQRMGLDHARSGDLVAVASPGHWFEYGWWRDPARAPDYARTVDIHRKPGYDPLELFIDPEIRFPRLAIARRLAARRLGFRTLLDVIPLDGGLVRGSHGRVPTRHDRSPLLITEPGYDAPAGESVPCTAVHDVICDHVLSPP